jgi:hypothetical protein
MDAVSDIKVGRVAATEFLESATGYHLRLAYVIIDGQRHPPFNNQQMLTVGSPQRVSGFDGCNHLSSMSYDHNPHFKRPEHPFWPFMWAGTMKYCRRIDENGNKVGVGDREFGEAMGKVFGYAQRGDEYWLFWGGSDQNALVFRPIPGDLRGTMWELSQWYPQLSAPRARIPFVEFVSTTKLVVYDGYDWHRVRYRLVGEAFTVEEIARIGEENRCEEAIHPFGPHFIAFLKSAHLCRVVHNNLYLYTEPSGTPPIVNSLGFRFIG